MELGLGSNLSNVHQRLRSMGCSNTRLKRPAEPAKPSGMHKKNKSARSKSSKPLVSEVVKGPHAILIADLHHERFAPLSQTLPPCLLPVGNVPILKFSVTNLIKDGFKSIIIYAGCLMPKVKKFVEQHIAKENSDVSIMVRSAESLRSLGDVMRDLDSSQSLSGVKEFLLAPADILCTTSMSCYLKEYQDIRNRSSGAILSLLLSHPTTLATKEQISEWSCNVIYSSSLDNSLVKIVGGEVDALSSIYLSDLITKEPSMTLTFGLLDVGLVICSDQVPILFQDNFDYRTMNDLVNDVLTNQEILPYTIHVKQLPPSSITLPMAPDLSSLMHLTPLVLAREAGTHEQVFPPRLSSDNLISIGPQIYVAKSASIHPSVRLIGACMIGPNCCVEAGSCLIDTVLGENCLVGPNCRLRRVIATDHVVIHEASVVDTSWLCSRARILDHVRLPAYCFIGPPFGDTPVTIGPGPVQIGEKSVLVSPCDPADFVLESAVGGEKAWATLYNSRTRPVKKSIASQNETVGDSLSDADDETSTDSTSAGLFLWSCAADRVKQLSVLKSQMSNRARLISSNSAGTSGRNRGKSSSIVEAENDIDVDAETNHMVSGLDDEADDEAFLIEEMKRTLERSQTNHHEADTIVLEVNSLKHAYNIPIEDLRFLLIKSLVELALDHVKDSRAVYSSQPPDKIIIDKLMGEFREVFSHFRSVINSYVSSSDGASRSCLQAVEDSACYNDLLLWASPFVFHYLYDGDIVSEEDIFWWRDYSPLLSDEDLTDKTTLLREKLSSFLKWLVEAEEEDDSDDEDDTD